ncbi:hypothetical protein [Lichenibacterium dinghuense]|uniref:hypothetical protein n=1 Tax=Lichenibacterium dinghuense TaxID=2895977 RepID=UPI001F1FDA56|nr:hypothetical protein [Lichenibacterium sp. 6Y81]
MSLFKKTKITAADAQVDNVPEMEDFATANADGMRGFEAAKAIAQPIRDQLADQLDRFRKGEIQPVPPFNRRTYEDGLVDQIKNLDKSLNPPPQPDGGEPEAFEIDQASIDKLLGRP